MADEKKQENTANQDEAPIVEVKVNLAKSAPLGGSRPVSGGERRRNFKGKRGFNRGRGDIKEEEFEQKIIDIARVTRVMAGGKRMRFRACVAIGNKKGRVAIGLAKGADVTMAVTKAVNKAKKNFIDIPIINGTIPHEIYNKYGAAKILFKPARQGRGIIAGGAVRMLLELSGIKNITSKILGTNNKINNVRCTIIALNNLKKVKTNFSDDKGKTAIIETKTAGNI